MKKKNNLIDEETDILALGLSKLNDFQKDALHECYLKNYGGICLSLGSGKSLIGLVLSLMYNKELKQPSLVIASKTLVESWVFEIKKFFGDSLKFVVFHANYIPDIDNFVMPDNIDIVLTTPESVAKAYKDDEINKKFIIYDTVNQGMFNQHEIKRYLRPERPYSTTGIGYSVLYSRKWSCMIVDEAQKYTNIGSLRCQGIGALCASHKFVTSGTLFNEPTTERMLGYHIIIDHDTFPRTLPKAEEYIKSSQFKGYNESIVYRDSNPAFIKPIVNEVIISHEMSPEEEKLYISIKTTMKNVKRQVEYFKRENQVDNARQFGTYLLAIICYLRQSVVCSVLPLANVAIDMTDFQNRSELSKMLLDETSNLGLDDWLNTIDAVKSTRIKKALEVVDNHRTDNLVIFSCFRTVIDIFRTFLPTDRKNFTISGDMSSSRRAAVLEDFKKPNENGFGNIMLLTYEIGAEGLNLQTSNTVLLLDFYWNNGKTEQAIARCLRTGQLSPVVNIYMFTSNLAIEKAMFEKHDLKLTILDELSTGAPKTKLRKMSVKDIIKIIEKEDNVKALQKVQEHRMHGSAPARRL